MTTITVTSVKDAGSDVLAVEGVRDAQIITATGWVSATTNHYDVDDEGARVKDAKPRTMTEAEILNYARALLAEQNPTQDVATARDLGLADPDAATALEAVAAREEAEKAAAEGKAL